MLYHRSLELTPPVWNFVFFGWLCSSPPCSQPLVAIILFSASVGEPVSESALGISCLDVAPLTCTDLWSPCHLPASSLSCVPACQCLCAPWFQCVPDPGLLRLSHPYLLPHPFLHVAVSGWCPDMPSHSPPALLTGLCWLSAYQACHRKTLG